MASAVVPKKYVRFSKRGEPFPAKRSQASCTSAVAWKVSPTGPRQRHASAQDRLGHDLAEVFRGLVATPFVLPQ